MKKCINAWCFDDNLSLEEIFSLARDNNFDGLEINMVEKKENSSNKLQLTIDFSNADLETILNLSKKYSMKIPSISTGLHWIYSLTDNDEKNREKGKQIVRSMIDAASYLGAETVLVVPGVVKDNIQYDIAYDRALEAFNDLKDYATEKKIIVGVENVWNRMFYSPLELRDFIDKINSDYIKVYFDAGNVLQFGFPHHWVKILGSRIAKVHIKDFDTSIGNIHGFKNLLHGSMQWAQLIDALKSVGYDDCITAELSPYSQNPNQLLVDTSAAMEWIVSL